MSGPTSLPTRTTGAIVSESSQERVPGTQASTPEPTRLKRGRSRWRRWRTTLIVLGVLVLVGGGWRLTHPPKPPAAPPVGEVKLADITQLVQASGILQARTKVDVGAQVSGQVQTLHVELGQNVKKGDLLVSLGGQAVTDTESLQMQLGSERVGKSTTAVVLRGGEPRELTIVPGER